MESTYELGLAGLEMSDPNPTTLLGGSGDLVGKVISPLIGVISNYKYCYLIFISLVTKSHDPLSK